MVSIKVLNAGAWSRSSERVPVSLPTEVTHTQTLPSSSTHALTHPHHTALTQNSSLVKHCSTLERTLSSHATIHTSSNTDHTLNVNIIPSTPSHISTPSQLEDFIPDCEDFYKKKHNGRKLYWHHMMSNGVVSNRVNCGCLQINIVWLYSVQ